MILPPMPRPPTPFRACSPTSTANRVCVCSRPPMGARFLRLLFHRHCRPLSTPGRLSAFQRGWLIVALDGSVFEAPDTPGNRRVLGSASNQQCAAAFPQLRLSARCEVGSKPPPQLTKHLSEIIRILQADGH